jgi:type IV secretory pathway VirB4 component
MVRGLPAKIGESDRYLNVAVFGKPGAGKTALLSNWWMTDSLFKTAKVLIDPSGFFAQEAYAMSGGYYCSIDHPIGINPMLDGETPDDTADNLIECINQVVKLSTDNVQLTVRMRYGLRDAIVWCVEHSQLRLDAVIDYLKTRSSLHRETKASLIDRLNLFIQDKRMHQILCEADPISWKDIAENRKSFILDCHGLSEDKMIFLGTLVTHGIKSYLRSSRGPFNPLCLYVDECHNFINPNYFTLLKEGRKYKVSAILATQDFTAMPANLTGVILSNVGTLVSFRVGYKEASLLSREFPTLQTQELQFLEKYFCAYRTPKNEGVAKTMPPPFVKLKSIETKGISKDEEWGWFTIDGSCP